MENFRQREGDESEPRRIKGRSVRREIAEIKNALQEQGYYDLPAKRQQFKIPFKWKSKANKFGKKSTENSILCFYLTKNGWLQGPMWLPVVGGNLIIYKNKGHEFIPSELWLIKIGLKTVPIYLIREIDRKPISNKDWDEVIARGGSTKDDEVLLKMLKLAMIEKVKTAMNQSLLYIIGGITALGIALYVIFA